MRLETITDRQRFERLAPQWDALVRAAPRPCPFQLHAWLEAWWETYGDVSSMRVEAAFRGERLVGALPLEIERRGGVLRVARLMGRRHAALADLLLAEGEPDETAQALLVRAESGPLDFLDLFGPYRGGVLDRIADRRRLRFLERIEAPTLHVRGTWEETLAAKTSAKRRSLYRRRRRQLDAAGGMELRLARSPDEVEQALETAFILHDLRRARLPDGSEFTTPRGKAFHRRALPALARQGLARIALVSVAERPVAFHSFFVLAETMVVHRLAFDPTWARLSPGIVATHEAIRDAVDAGARRVEFLGGRERYKLELADRLEPIYECIGMGRGARGRAGAALARGAVGAQLRLKRSRTFHSFYVKTLAPVRKRRTSRRSGT